MTEDTTAAAAAAASPVHLGFCEAVEEDDDDGKEHIAHHSPLWSEWDGGQVGGRPSWLNPEHLPTTLLCDVCSKPLRFLCQLYAPADSINPQAFHRTLYVFGCPCTSCSSDSIRVLRTQLARYNSYFPEKGDDDAASSAADWNKHFPETYGIKLCQVCGQRGKGVCPLQGVSFCSKHHQKEHKRHIFDNQQDVRKERLPSMYQLYELVVEEEPPSNETEEEAMRETLFESNDDEDDQDLEQDDLNRITGTLSDNKDPTTVDFFLRTSRQKDQCIRYHQWQNGGELWLRSEERPIDGIPSCPYCGAPRRFEFQLMPQLLHYLRSSETNENNEILSKKEKEALLASAVIVEQNDPSSIPPALKETHDNSIRNVQAKMLKTTRKDLDWGVVVVYTCTASCGGGHDELDPALGSYREEYVVVQTSLG